MSTDTAVTPVNHVRVGESHRQLIVDECVICGETHRHGALDAKVADGGRSHRVSHCDRSGGYWITLADDANPPEDWCEFVAINTDYTRGDCP